MNLEDGISTLNEAKIWTDFLLKHSKEELVDLLIDKMIRDEYLYKEVVLKLVKCKSDVKELIDYYVKEVELEMSQEIVSMDFLSTLSETMLDIGKHKSFIEKVDIESSVIQCLDVALCSGAGYENQDDFILVDVIKRCGEQMLNEITKCINNLSESDYVHMHHYMSDKSIEFKSYASKNYFKIAEEKFFTK